LGWADGRNVRMNLRWGDGDINRMRAFAQELVGLQPDIIMTDSCRSGALARIGSQDPLMLSSLIAGIESHGPRPPASTSRGP
jgi:hypothetical protein